MITLDVRKTIIAFIIILLVAIFFRFKHWPGYLTFDYEKARDLISSRNIFLNKKPTLLGPTTEVEGIFHGPLYYYLVGFCYFIFNGNPSAGSIVSFGFNFAALVALFFIGKNLFNKRVGLIAAFLYAVSFEAVSYAYWLSNPGPSVVFLFLMFYFFYLFLAGKDDYLIWSLFCFGISMQFQVLNIIFAVPLLVSYLLLRRSKIPLKNLFFPAAALLLPISTFILFEIKHNFLMINTFLNRYFSSSSGSGFKFNLFGYLARLSREFSHVLFPISEKAGWPLLAVILGFLFIKVTDNKKSKLWKYLIIWIFSTFPIFLINSRIGESSAAFIGVSGGIILAFACFLDYVFKKRYFFYFPVLLIIFLGNLYAVDNYLTNPGKRLFDFFEGLFLSQNLALIDYTYKDAGNEAFRIDTVTSPLYISPLWDYLYEWRGKSYYHLYPQTNEEVKIHYLIIEPVVAEHFKDEAIKKKEDLGKLEKSETFGQVVVQKWIIKN